MVQNVGFSSQIRILQWHVYCSFYSRRTLIMLPDEKAIIEYLKGWPNTFVSGREIARKVGGRNRYESERGWALPVLTELVRKGYIECDYLGYYRLVNRGDKKKRFQKFVSPEILRILKSSGKNFEGVVHEIDEDLDEEIAELEKNKDKEKKS